MHKKMDENFLNVLYIEHTDKIGVLKDDKEERVSIILGTDKTLVERKREDKTYLLVPLTKNHTFKCNGDSLEVDGKIIPSKVFFRKNACQWIEIDEETLSKVA
jgi:hypothetical protein|nr:MAG: hypothetical protein [Bacteriophage sp.]